MSTLTTRAKIVHKALSEAHWTSVSGIMKAGALRDHQRNRRLAPTAQRRAVNRALDELVAHGHAEEKTEPGERGLPTRFVRRAHMTGQVFVTEDNVFED